MRNIILTLKMNFLEFPKITQFNNCISNIKKNCYQDCKILQYEGTVKLHGTHSDIIYNKELDIIYFQSRNRIITKDKDNYEFAEYMDNIPLYVLKELFSEVIEKYPDENIFAMNGEWCGENIQRNVALSMLSKMFVIYSISIYKNDLKSKYEYTLLHNVKNEKYRIYNIYQFQTYHIDIDFENPHLSVNTLETLTDQVEKECPVGKYFNVSGIGEGIVWKCLNESYNSAEFWFKVKGKEHRVTKSKNLVSIDVEKIQNIEEFIDYVLTQERFEQGISYLKEMNMCLDKTSTNNFVNWIISDVYKEEKNTLIQNNLIKNNKLIGKKLRYKSSKWFINNITNENYIK